MSMDVTCLFSVVKNTSGLRKRFSVLPPHGVELDANEEYTVFGSVLEALQRSSVTGRANSDAFTRLVDAGDLEIRALPKPILTDEGTDEVKMIELLDGELILRDPCWTSLSIPA